MQVLNSNHGGLNCLVSVLVRWACSEMSQPSHIRVGFPGFKPIDQLSVLLFPNMRPSNLHNCSNKFADACLMILVAQ